MSDDVIVIGGGPGGAAAATMLARKGARVLLLERERFPRDHIGESLLPASIPVLEELGALPAVQEAGFLPKWGATMVWGKEQTPWSWYFRETNRKHPHSYQVWRPQFDQLLLENSRASGVDVREGHRVVGVFFEAGRAAGVHYLAPDGSQRTARARFIVDASGQSGLLAHKLGLRRWDSFFQNLAVYGYFAGARRLPPPDETNIFIESYPHGWFWNIPLHTGWASVGAVVDSRWGQQDIGAKGLQRFLIDQIAQAPRTAAMLQRADLVSGPFIVKDWSYVCDRMVGDGYILVGDAACFVDPLFSSGVHLALMSGVLAAAYVATAFKDSGMQEAAAQVYRELYLKEYGHFRDMARLFYSSNRTIESYFWEARRLLGDDDSLSPRQAFIQAVAGQPPRGYERVVLEQGRAPAGFVDSVRSVESERADRQARLEAALAGVPLDPPVHGGTKGGFRTQRDHIGVAQSRLYRAVPRLGAGVRVERKPVLAAGEFQWGYVVTTAGHPEGMPCSGLVARLVSLIDGRTSVAGLLSTLRSYGSADQQAQIENAALSALQILYVDGTVAELEGLGGPG